MKKMSIVFTSLILSCLFAVTPALAHVTVKPQEVGIGTFQTFTVGVPNEKDNSTTQVRLVLPERLEHVSPNVKPGWTIEVKHQGDEDNTLAMEIIWSGGIIPEGQRDDFQFSAKVPAEETTLTWKAYQTYADGTVVAWDIDPKKEKTDSETQGPFSQTRIINDLKEEKRVQSFPVNEFSLPISILALFLAIIALLQIQQKGKLN